MKPVGRSVLGTALGALVASFLVALTAPGAHAATCSLAWNHSNGSAQSWSMSTNWQPVRQPLDGDAICITNNTTDHVFVDKSQQPSFHLDSLQLSGASAELEVRAGAGLFVDTSESVLAAGTNSAINTGQMGGLGTLRVQGSLFFADPLHTGTSLSSGTAAQPATPGTMVVEGRAEVVHDALGLSSGYRVNVAAGGNLVLDPGTFMTADRGTATTIASGGAMVITGDGGYYQGAAVSGQSISSLTNNGVVKKTGGSGTSVIDAKLAGTGQFQVQSGTLALPDASLVGATVWPGTALATGRCAPGVPTSTCQPTVDPSVDAMSVSFTVPAGNAGATGVQLQELAPVSAFQDPNEIGNEVLAHADSLGAAALIQLRFSQADVMATALDQIQVVHTPDSGPDILLPDCVNGALPAGLSSCVVRPATRTATNTFVNVLTTTTSRWHLRRGQHVENQGAPTAPQGLKLNPGDGSVVKVSWSAPASPGAGPVSSYRVFADGTRKATSTGTTAKLKNLGPGRHTITVAAVNAAGQGPKVSAKVRLAALSRPRQVTGVEGRAGSPATAGVRWRPPASAGGLVLKAYVVTVLRANGSKVTTTKVKAGKRSATFTLPAGRYRFKVRAVNADGPGPWSALTAAVRSR